MPRVLNKYKDTIPKDAVYIGRGSKWGNPYKITQDQSREVVISRYKDYLGISGLLTHIDELRGKDLVCFCSPKPCHGDILLELSNR